MQQPDLQTHLRTAHENVVRVRYRDGSRFVLRRSSKGFFGCVKCGSLVRNRNNFIVSFFSLHKHRFQLTSAGAHNFPLYR